MQWISLHFSLEPRSWPRPLFCTNPFWCISTAQNVCIFSCSCSPHNMQQNAWELSDYHLDMLHLSEDAVMCFEVVFCI